MSTNSTSADPGALVRLEIVDLLHRLAHAADAVPDAELATRYRPCFTDDAVWEMRSPSATERRVGIDDIMDGATERRRSGRSGPGAGVRHHITTVVIVPASELAWTVTSYFMVTDATSTVRSSGGYTDRIVRTGDHYRIAERTVDIRPRGAPDDNQQGAS